MSTAASTVKIREALSPFRARAHKVTLPLTEAVPAVGLARIQLNGLKDAYPD